ncbi:MAG: hypothetical protein CR986_05180 [Ignavibacteriae bacterium]|nr:MAG: hypothetical protein CR986_05180 [Ignavibacteriota bacterium]
MRIFLVAFFVFIGNVLAQELYQYNKLIKQSEHQLNNFKFVSAKELVDSAISINSKEPKAYELLAKTHLWYFLGSKNDSDYVSFLSYCDSVIEKSDELIDEKGIDKKLLYLLASVYKFKAMAYGTVGNTLDAFWATKKSVSYFEEVIALDKNFYSAYGGIGIFQYALSYVPTLFDWALSLSGLSSNKEEGFQNILIAAKKGGVDKAEYQFHLAKLYDEYLADYDNSLKIIAKLIKKYPDNILFKYQKAVTLIKAKKINKAEIELQKIVKTKHQKFQQTYSFSLFLLGDINFRNNNYKDALEYYLRFLTTTKTIDYTGIASLRTAYCYYFLDDTLSDSSRLSYGEAEKYLLRAANGNLDLEDDNYAKEKSIKILKNSFTQADKDLLIIQNYYLSGKNKKLFDYVDNIDSVSAKKNNIEINLYKAASLIEVDKFIEAEKLLVKNDSLELDTDNWIEPMSYFLKAKLYYIKKDLEKTEELLELAESSNDYQKKNLIASYINGLKKKLKKLKKKNN